MTTPLARPTPAAAPGAFATRVQRARSLLRLLILLTLALGGLSTLVSALAAQDALSRYRAIVSESTTSADAAQEARAALLDYHSQGATFLVDGAEGAPPSDETWLRYQEALRRLWANRQPDDRLGEAATFDALDAATLRYRARLDTMQALVARDDRAGGQEALLEGHEVLVREALPALNGLEGLKLDNMEAAYATTNASVSRAQTIFFVIGAALLILLFLGWLLTRSWLRYRWTWEIVVATLAALLLFVWFNASLWYAARSVEVLVRDTYDSVSATQSIEALLTQARAMESLALFAPERAEEFLRDGDEYFFLLQQRLCGEPEPSCLDRPFTIDNQTIDPAVREQALLGQGKYGLPQPPLVANASRAAEIEPLESLRGALLTFREAGQALRGAVGSGEPAPAAFREQSESAYAAALDAAARERGAVRGAFDSLYNQVTVSMSINRLLALLFSALAGLAFWGLRRRRTALFT